MTNSENNFTEKKENKLISQSDGLEISTLIIEPNHINLQQPKGIIQIVHGMCEYKERYIPFMRYLASEGFICVIHDHRGHGKSIKDENDLGYFYEGGYLAMIDDIRMVGEWAKSVYGNLPFILFGHSMGSMAVRAFTKRYDDSIDGLIVCGSPSQNSGAGMGKLLAKLYSKFKGEKYRPKLIQNIAFKSFNKPFTAENTQNAWICSDPNVVAKYNSDDFCNFQFTANGFYNLFSLMQDTYELTGWKVSRQHLPILFISGADDPCLICRKKFNHAVKSMIKVGYKNVHSILIPDMRHEILNEKAKEYVWEEILSNINFMISRS